MRIAGSCAIVLASLAYASIPQTMIQAEDATVTTWHGNNDRNGLNPAESLLAPNTVYYENFGKVGFFSTDGIVDAEPLHVAGLTINGAVHNVVFAASEHASVYAFDAQNGAVLWKTSLLKAGETTSDDHGCSQISPEIGITSTPVIDTGKGPHGIIYVVNMSKDKAGKYHQRINALDLVTGVPVFGPTEIAASYPGTGDNSSNGSVVFDPAQYAERAGLLEWNGAIYTAWTSHCDARPYTGWIMSYDATTLKQTAVLNVTPNGSEGSVWMSGSGLAAGPTKIMFLDANGTFDTTLDGNGFPIHQDYGNAVISLVPSGSGGLQVSDYYATDNTVQESNADTDLGSGGLMILPYIQDNAGNGHHLAVGAGKDHNIYLLDMDNLGKYHPNGGSIYQVLTGALPNGAWSSPAYFNNKIYYGGVRDTLKAFTISNAKLVSTPSSASAYTFPYPGTTPSISANGTTNGIVWTVSHANPSVLYAYNAEDLSDKLYDSGQDGSRDQLGTASHFCTPTIANGHVYVGTTTGIAVYGLLK